MTKKIHALEACMDLVSQQLSIPSQVQPQARDAANEVSTRREQAHPPTADEDIQDALQGSWEVRMDIESGPATIPVLELDSLRSRSSGPGGTTGHPWDIQSHSDIISQGILSLHQARALFDVYALRLDHYLYRILGETRTLEEIRSGSPLLVAAICAVGALHSIDHDLGSLFDECCRYFETTVSKLSISTKPNIDDIRGLCIGAFWLHRLSWNLSSMGEYRDATLSSLLEFMSYK